MIPKGDFCTISAALTIAAGAVGSTSDLRLNDSGAYTIESINVDSLLAGVLQTDALGLIQISNKGTGVSLFTEPVFIPSLVSFGKRGQKLVAPRSVGAGHSLQISITNQHAAAATFNVLLHCKRA